MTSAVDPSPKPRLRGVSHLYACFLAVIAGIFMVLVAASFRARIAACVYSIAQTALFGLSALYHLPRWGPRAEPWFRRLDHAAIFVFIAASYTPFCVLALGQHGSLLLALVWGFAALGLVRALLWIDAPPWVCATIYVVQGWMVVPYLPHMASQIGVAGIVLISIAGLCYTVGAVIFSIRRPDPVPAIFGYHEIFHVLVILGCACQFSAIIRLVATAA